MPGSQQLPLLILAAPMLGITGRWRGWFRRRPRRVRQATWQAQLESDFAPGERAEAAALLEELASHAREDDREIVRRKVLDGVRGDLAKLRRAAPKSAAALERIYQLLGDGAEGSRE